MTDLRAVGETAPDTSLQSARACEAMSVGVFVFEGVEELDFVGPWEMLTMWRSYAKGPNRIETFALDAGHLKCAKGLTIVPDSALPSHSYDIVVVPGGFAAIDFADDPKRMKSLSPILENAEHCLSVCTGAYILAAAGLLKGRSAATHWKTGPDLSSRGVDVQSRRYVHAPPVWTSAGVSAGMDMILAFIASIGGEAAAASVQYNSEYYPEDVRYGRSWGAPAPDYAEIRL
ncbi:MAG: DJ-1/PfpI family protein [Pseudomonadota bacterium]